MRWFLLLACLAVMSVASVLGAFLTVPTTNTGLSHFDTLIVLGCPARGDGSPSLEQRERVSEAAREYRAGRAGHMILTGAAAHNQYVEAAVMRGVALAEGIPPDAIVEERQAQNTIQNIFYSDALMQKHGWQSAEVISSPNHLPRTELILGHWHFPWRTDAARWPPEYSRREIAEHDAIEAVETAKLRFFGFAHSPFLPQS